jgi:hypothetical protein
MPILNPGRGISNSPTRARDTQTDGKLAAVRANPANLTVRVETGSSHRSNAARRAAR